MTRPLRTAGAIAFGVVTVIFLGYAGMVVFVLATIGIPLGAQPAPLRAREYAVLLLIGGTAAVIGGRVAARVDGERRGWAVAGVSLLLAATLPWAFNGTNSWPDWWGPAVAAVMVIGTCVGGLVQR